MPDKISPVQYSMKFNIDKPARQHFDDILNIFYIKLSVLIKGIIIRKI
jgi:hypothetical protein